MRNFTSLNYPTTGSSSYRHLVKGFLLGMAMVLFQFTQMYAQEINYEGEGSSNTGLRYNLDGDYELPGDSLNPDIAANVDCANLRVVLVLDESGSMKNNGEPAARDGAWALAQSFKGSEARLIIVEFESLAREITNLEGGRGEFFKGVVDDIWLANFHDYLYSSYEGQQYFVTSSTPPPCRRGYTNWEDALLKSHTFSPNLVLFLTDGDPTASNTVEEQDGGCYWLVGTTPYDAPSMAAAITQANVLKEDGVHIFSIGVGSNVNVNGLKLISGYDEYNGNLYTDDYSIGGFDDIKNNLTSGINNICGTELSIEKSVDHPQVCSSDEVVTFTITVTNTGGSNDYAASEIVVLDTFPSFYNNLAIVGAPIDGAEILGQNLTYSFESLDPNESVTIQVSANFTGLVGTSSLNTAYASADNANQVEDDAIVKKTDIIHSNIEVAECGDYTWDKSGDTYTASGQYTASGFTQSNCPRMDTLNLTINEPRVGSEAIDACITYEWNEEIYDTSGDYTHVFTGINGLCDSTATLQLTIHQPDTTHQYVSTCEPYYEWNNEYYFETGNYFVVFPGLICDNVAVLHLTINEPDGDVTIEACESYEWNGTTYDESGTYFFVGDCGTTTLHLTINQPTFGEETVTSCVAYAWNGEVYDASGSYTHVFSGDGVQCDSTATLHLTVESCCAADAGEATFNDGTTEKTICADDGVPSLFTYAFPTAANSALSTVYLVTDASGNIVHFAVDVPEAESFNFDLLGAGTWNLYVLNYDDSDSNIDALAAIHVNGGVVNVADFDGCFDLSTPLVAIGSLSPSGEETIVACESYDWNGNPYDVSGDYTHVFPGEGGKCDSTATLHLTINQPTFGEETVTSCDAYAWNGEVYDASGSYTHVFPGENGQCDSTATLHLTVESCCAADAGSVTFSDGTTEKTICTDDGVPSLFTFVFPIHWNTSLYTRGILTDVSGNIIYYSDNQAEVQAIDFDSYGPGTLYLYVFNYKASASNFDNLAAIFDNGGDVNISDITGCYDFSNHLVIIGDDSPSGEETVVACESYDWNGNPYDVSGDYTHVFPGENGKCDSTATLHLTISHPTESTESQTACGAFEWNGTVYTTSGLYSYVDESGVCPHTYYLDLVIEICGNETCANFKYYYIAGDTPGVPNGTVFSVALSGTNAVLTELFQSGFDDGHIAIDEVEKLIYVISGDGTEINTYNMAGVFQTSVGITGLQRTVAIASDPTHPGKVLVGDQNLKKVYRLDPTTGLYTVVVENAPVFGGDIYFIGNQSYLIERVNSTHSVVYNISTGVAIFEATIAPAVNGASATASNGIIVASGNYSTHFYTYDADGSNQVALSAIFAGGETFTIVNGDMAGGCFDVDECDFVMYLASDQNLGVGGSTEIYSMTINPDQTTTNTLMTTVDFPCHGIAHSPEGISGKLYLVETAQTHSSFVKWDINSNTQDGSTVNMVTSDGQNIPNVPAAVYKDGVLYVASYFHNKVYMINPSTGVAFDFISTDVNGGDLVFDKNGDLWYIHRYNQMFVNLSAGGSFVIPSLANIHGVVVMPNGSFMVANGDGGSEFYKVDPVAGALVPGGLYETGINQLWGDMAGVDCFGGEVTPPTNPFVAIKSQAVLTSYPNPTKGPSKVVFTTDVTTQTLVEVYDMNGRNVGTLFNQEAQMGKEYTLDFNGDNLPNGVYIYRMTTNNETIVEKFMIAR